MADPVRVMLERGRKQRDVAVAFDWPGWDRWAKQGQDLLAVLESYRPRYARVADLAGYGEAFAAAGPLTVVEDVPGIGMTGFYGVSMVSATPEREPMTAAECDRKLALLQAAWATLDATAERVSEELRLGPRGGGRSRERIVRHVNGAEIDEFAPKVGIKVPLETREDPEALRAYRDALVHAIRDRCDQGEVMAGNWTLQFLIRHAAYHMLDHAWEMEDRDLTEPSTA
jgi:hypothetical protein